MSSRMGVTLYVTVITLITISQPFRPVQIKFLTAGPRRRIRTHWDSYINDLHEKIARYYGNLPVVCF